MSSTGAKPGESTGQTFTVQEAGKPGQKCKVLKTWKTHEGATAYQVQALDTGEMMTIVETGGVKNLPGIQGSHAQAVATRIFHWGLERMPPAGTPTPPVEDMKRMPAALPDPEPKKLFSAERPEAAKPNPEPKLMAAEHPESIRPIPVRPEVTRLTTTVTQPEPAKSTTLFPWLHRSAEPQVSQMPTNLPQPSALASSPAIQPMTTQQANTVPLAPDSAGPRDTGFHFPWFHRSPEPQVSQMPTNLPQPSAWNHSPTTQPTATVQNTTAPVAPALTGSRDTGPLFPWFHRSTETQVLQTPTNPSQTSTSGPSSATQPTTTLPNSVTPTAPASTGRDTPRTTKPSTTTDPQSEAPAQRPTASVSSAPATSTVTSPTPQKAATPQRLVQVLPTKNDAPAPAPTTTSTAPAAPAPQSPLLNRQAISLAPVTSVAIPNTNEKKPANATADSSAQPMPAQPGVGPTISQLTPAKPVPTPVSAPTAQVSPAPVYKAPVSNWATTSPAATNSVAQVSPTPVYKTPVSSNTSSSVSFAQAGSQVGSAATSLNRFDDTKLTPATPAPSPVAAASTSAPVTAAPLTDWRKSWGKTDDAKAPIVEKPIQSSGDSKSAPAKPLLPQADSKRVDPLQSPAQYDRRPVDEKPSVQKSSTTLAPAGGTTSVSYDRRPADEKPSVQKSSMTLAPAGGTTSVSYDRRPAEEKLSVQKSDTTLVPASGTSSVAVKPVVTPIAPLAKAPSSMTTMQVPLGAQSVVQAGDPGPGGVRYIPVPMVTIPEVRPAPVPPMTSSAQVYGTSGTVSAGSAGTQANAFTPMLPRQAYAQSTNAFTNGVPISPGASSGSPVPAVGASSMVAQAAAGNNNSANSSVVTASFPGAGLANKTAPATQQTTAYQMQSASLTPAKATPENVRHMVTALKDSLYPSQREWAAQSMASVDWRAHPQVVQALTTAAKEDPAATVRAGCVHSLAKMNANTAPVITVIRELKKDPDPRVRQVAEQALTTLNAGTK
jgi:hypothetical protein